MSLGTCKGFSREGVLVGVLQVRGFQGGGSEALRDMTDVSGEGVFRCAGGFKCVQRHVGRWQQQLFANARSC